MSRHARSLEQIRTLLRQMDRSVDDARARREGVPRTEPGTNGPFASNAAQTLIGVPTPVQAPASSPPSKPVAPAQSAPRPAVADGHASPMSALSGGVSPQSAGGPPRMKAKPKKAGSPDPLQDFQQRQAS